MKIFALIVAAVLLSSQIEAENFKDVTIKALHDVATRSLSDKLYNKIESFKAILKNGNETYGIPVLDPFKIEHEEYTLDTEIFKGFVIVNDLISAGLAEYITEKADLSLIQRKMSVTLRWPLLEEQTYYKVISSAYNQTELYGDGGIQSKAEEFKFKTEVYFGLSLRGGVYIKKMNSQISLGNFKFNITGLFNDEEISKAVSAFISELVLQIVQDLQTELVTAVNTQIITHANEFLKGLSFSDLIDLVNS